MKAEKDEVLRQNEIDANKLQVVALLVAAISFLVVYIFVQLGIFRVHRWHEDAVKIVMVITEVFMISAVVISIHYKYEKP